MPDLWLMLGHVHRQQHELPGRGARAGPAGERHTAGHTRATLGSLRNRRPPHRRDGPTALPAGQRRGAPAQHRVLAGLRERHDARHRHGRLDQYRVAHPGRRARGGCELHHGRHRSSVAQGAQHLQGGALIATPPRGRAPRGRHLHHSGRVGPRRPHPPRGQDRARADHGPECPPGRPNPLRRRRFASSAPRR